MAKSATKTKASKPAAPPSGLVIVDCVQGTPEWFQARCGIPTASNFATVMADGRDGGPSLTRTQLLYELAGEIITGDPAEETFKSKAMQRGKEMEGDAVADYEVRRGVEVHRIGFGRNFSGLKECGASPDGLVGFDGGLETKTMKPSLLIPLLEKGARMVPAHRAQVHGNMYVFERDWWDLKIFWPRMPDFTVRVYRDDVYIREISNEIERFNHEKHQLVERLRRMGAS